MNGVKKGLLARPRRNYRNSATFRSIFLGNRAASSVSILKIIMNKSIYGDPELIRWLNREIRLFPAIVDIEKQFQNWFYFQEVLLRTGNPLKEILLNKFDEVNTRKNQKIVKKHVIKLIGIEPKLEKGQSEVEEYLKAIKTIAKPIQQNTVLLKARQETHNVLEALTKTLKITDKHQVHSLFNNHEEKFINSLPPRVRTIEQGLQKYRDEKLIHEIKSVKLKQKEEEKEREWLQSLRQVELEKLRANHQFIKDQDKNIYTFWWNTEKVRHDRINRETQFNLMMTNRLKDAVVSAKKADEEDMEETFKLFIQTCIRQGVEIEKDPAKKPVPEKAKFSAVATMMKIRERTRHNEEARKARQKRKNKMLVDQKRQQEEVDAKKKLENLLDTFMSYGVDANRQCEKRYTDNLRGELQFKERQLSAEFHKERIETFFDQLRKEARDREQEVRRQAQIEWRQKQLEYMHENYQRKVEKRLKHNIQMQPLILSILDLTDKCYLSMQNANSNGQPTNRLDSKLWLKLVDEWKQEISQIKPTHDNIVAEITQEFSEYYNGVRDWRPTLVQAQLYVNQALAQYLFDIIDHIYPMEAPKMGVDYFCPLKIALIGGKFSGRKTTAKYLALKYGLDIFDIEQIIQESLKQAFPPIEDPKKKKDPKKPPEPVLVENPELKAYGLEINEFKDRKIPDEILLKGILIKLKQTYGNRTPQQVYQEMKEAQELQRKKEQIVPVEEVKKVTKKPGKGKEVQQTGPSQEDLLKEYLNSKQFYYTKGWVMIGFPESFAQAKLLEQELTGYVPLNERLNQEAELRKKKISELLDYQPEEDSVKLMNSGLDVVINLEASMEQRVQRMSNRRLDPNTEIIYNLEENPPPPEIKVDKLLKIEAENEEKIAKDFNEFMQNKPQLQQWCEQFGLTDDLILFQTISPQGKGLDVAKQVDQLIDKVLSCNKETYLQFFEEESGKEQQRLEMVDIPTETIGVGGEDAKPQEQLEQSDRHLHSRSQQSGRLTDKEEYLNAEQLANILKQWDEISNTYIKETTIYIRRMNHQRRRCQALFLQHQKQFLELFESQDEKMTMLHLFQQKFNKFLSENEDLSKQKNAKQQIKEHLQVLYEQLWDVMNKKKQDALKYLQKIKAEKFVLGQVQQFMQHVLMMLQTETNLLTEIIHLGKPWSEHFILEPPAAEIMSGYKYPQLETLVEYYAKCLEQVTIDEESKIIQTQKDIALKRGLTIQTLAYSKMTEMVLMEEMLYSRIDDWIIKGIKQQNDFCYSAINYFKQCIESRTIAVLSIPEPPLISDSFKMIYMSNHLIPQNESFRLLIQIYEEINSLSESGKVSLALFDAYMQRRTDFQQLFVMNREKFEQLLVQNEAVNLKSYFIAISLWNCTVPQQNHIKKFISEIKELEVEFYEDFFVSDFLFWFEEELDNSFMDMKYFLKRFMHNVLKIPDLPSNLNEALQPFYHFSQYNYKFQHLFDVENKGESSQRDI